MSGEEAARMQIYRSPTADRYFAAMAERCGLPAAPAVATDPHGNVIIPVAAGDHDLNLSKSYAHWIGGFGSIRELVQNWFDRTIEVLQGQPTYVNDSGWHDGTRVVFPERACAGESRPRCASFLLEQKSERKVYIQLTNFATALPKDALVMGCSRKGSTDAAGAYGEGMKVEINCLVARGAHVTIFTGGRIWYFLHAMEPGGSESKLFMRAVEAPACGHLSISIIADEDVIAEVDRSKFLFLQPEQPFSCGGDDVVEILLNEQHHGKMFARGIFITKDSSLEGIGLNFVGPLTTHKMFDFTRDRDSINLEKLIAWLPMTVQYLREQQEAAFLLANVAARSAAANAGEAAAAAETAKYLYMTIVKRLYDILLHKGQSAVAKNLALSFWGEGYLCRPSVQRLSADACKQMEEAREKLADDFVEIFVKGQDQPRPYPVDDAQSRATEDEIQEATFLRCTPIPVPKLLLKHLRLSAKCPTTEHLWKELEQEVYCAKTWTPSDEAQRMIAARYIRVAYEWFGDALTPGMLIFKEFPPGNNRPVLVGRGPCHEMILALDVTVLGDVNAAHQWLRKEHLCGCIDPVTDSYGCQACGTACLMLRYSEALTTCLKKVRPDLRKDLTKRQTFSMMRMQTRDLPNVQVPPPGTTSPTSSPVSLAPAPSDVTASADISVLPVRELKSCQGSLSMDKSGCLENSELRQLLQTKEASGQEETSSVGGLTPNTTKPYTAHHSSARMSKPPAGRRKLQDGGRGSHLPKKVYTDEPEGTLCMDQDFNDDLGIFLPSEDKHGFEPPELLQQLLKDFNEALDLVRKSFHTGRVQVFPSWSPFADWLGLHHHDGLCLINIALVQKKAEMVGVICHEISHEYVSAHDVCFGNYLQHHMTEVIQGLLQDAPRSEGS